MQKERKLSLKSQKTEGLKPSRFSQAISNTSNSDQESRHLLTSHPDTDEKRQSKQIKETEFDLRRPSDFEKEKSDMLGPLPIPSPPGILLAQRKRTSTTKMNTMYRDRLFSPDSAGFYASSTDNHSV